MVDAELNQQDSEFKRELEDSLETDKLLKKQQSNSLSKEEA